ncbi:zinc carboxypeptidase-like [Orussus abietinus]|uniref:zinc carboxypeptidase-like n=1 Tax=Orussus abietinus TaxID=222816 RepID=UPI0006253D53|nr:zinc carboxypeptidase-like [Orussus abietinus]
MKWNAFGLIAVLVATATAEKVSYQDFKVFRVLPKTTQQLQTLSDLENLGYSFWLGPSKVGANVDLMVSPEQLEGFQDLVKENGLEYEEYVQDVQTLIDQENPRDSANRVSGELGWTSYHTLGEIYDWLEFLGKTYPDKVTVVKGGSTYEGREIKGVRVSFKENNPGVFIEGGIHAREWITPATVTYFLNELLTSKDPEVRELAERHDWYIFPVFNPDGYIFTHTGDRLWRKTRRPYGRICKGVDANRNWDYKWMMGGASSAACSETFAGSSAFSEVETQTLSEYIGSIGDKFYAYIAFHSYSQLLLFPYGHTKQHLDNYDELYEIGTKTIQALSKRYGTRYVTGNIAETIYIASGCSMDWVKGTLRTPITFTYELRDKGRYGFLLPANQIIPTGQEVVDSLVALFREAKAKGYPKTAGN